MQFAPRYRGGPPRNASANYHRTRDEDSSHPRVFNPPTPLDRAIDYLEALRQQPNAVLLQPRPRHWSIFIELCRAAGARGNLVADAYHAALAIEHGAEWITTDGDFKRFNGLRTGHPLI
jgi:toxin-antitoxin system PIN domain toxin